MLMGLVTKNAILLVDFFNQARERGTPVNEPCSRPVPSGCARS